MLLFGSKYHFSTKDGVSVVSGTEMRVSGLKMANNCDSLTSNWILRPKNEKIEALPWLKGYLGKHFP